MGNYNLSEADALFSLDEDEDFDYILSDFMLDYMEVVEKPPADFDIDKLEGDLDKSKWADQEGVLEVEPITFVVEILAEEAPENGSCSMDFIGWQESYDDVGGMMHGLDYHGPASIHVSLKRTWKNKQNRLFAEYEVTDIYED
mgnify:CR=1 FL=1